LVARKISTASAIGNDGVGDVEVTAVNVDATAIVCGITGNGGIKNIEGGIIEKIL
jgi:hypothetical protein